MSSSLIFSDDDDVLSQLSWAKNDDDSIRVPQTGPFTGLLSSTEEKEQDEELNDQECGN